MNSKEHVLRTFERREADRVPINYSANPGIDMSLKAHFGLKTDDYDYSAIAKDCWEFRNYAVYVGGPGLACIINTAGFFRGMEQIFVDLALDEPAGLRLIDRMLAIQLEVTRRSIEAAEGGVDFMWIGEDLGTQKGPMISKELFDEFMKPYYQMVIPHLKNRGIKVFIDSDGDVHEPAGWFTEAGIQGILPLEAQAGVNLAKLRNDNPEQLYIAGYDKMKMPGDEESMRAEFERLLPVAKQGGYIISCDHQTPPGVSLENYRIYMKLFNEYAKKAGNK